MVGGMKWGMFFDKTVSDFCSNKKSPASAGLLHCRVVYLTTEQFQLMKLVAASMWAFQCSSGALFSTPRILLASASFAGGSFGHCLSWSSNRLEAASDILSGDMHFSVPPPQPPARAPLDAARMAAANRIEENVRIPGS